MLAEEVQLRLVARKAYLKHVSELADGGHGGIDYLKRHRLYTPFRAKYARAKQRVYRPTFWKVAGMIATGDKGAGPGAAPRCARQRLDRESGWTAKVDRERRRAHGGGSTPRGGRAAR